MAICQYCNREMNDGTGCTGMPVRIDGKDVPPAPWGGVGLCPDCNAPVGAFHHPGCDRERCPACGHQAISCGCADEDDDA